MSGLQGRSFMSETRVLFRCAGLRLSEKDDSLLLLRQGPYPFQASVWGLLHGSLFAFCTLLAIWAMHEMLSRSIAAFLLATDAVLLMLTMTLLAVIATLQMLLPRRWTFCNRRMVAELRQLPRLRLTIPFSQIAAVELVIQRNQEVGWVCLSRTTTRRLLIVCHLKRAHRAEDFVMSGLARVAHKLSAFMGKPLEQRTVWGLPFWRQSWW